MNRCMYGWMDRHTHDEICRGGASSCQLASTLYRSAELHQGRSISRHVTCAYVIIKNRGIILFGEKLLQESNAMAVN